MKFFQLDNLNALSKIFPNLSSQYWRLYAEETPEVSASRRFHQLFRADQLVGLYKSGKLSSADFLADLGKFLPMEHPPSLFELLVRAMLTGKIDPQTEPRGKGRRGPKDKSQEMAQLVLAIARDIQRTQTGLSKSKLTELVLDELRSLELELAGKDGKALLVHSKHTVQRLLALGSKKEKVPSRVVPQRLSRKTARKK